MRDHLLEEVLEAPCLPLEGPIAAIRPDAAASEVRLEHVKHYSITSDGIAPGSIQVTGTGQPIVLLADRQTIGGYAKIATVITADLPALARLPIGAKVAFEPVSIEVAVAARRQLLAQLASFDEQVMPIIGADVDIAPRLLDCNLISGFVDGRGSVAP